jgi:hypothetical protein
MAMIRITDGTDTVDIDPAPGYVRPKAIDRAEHKGEDGTDYVYEFSSKVRDEIPVKLMAKADADIINAWMTGRTSLTYYQDYSGAPGTSVTARIVNATLPLQMDGPLWDTYYSGTIIVQET